MHKTQILQCVRLKRRVAPEDVAICAPANDTEGAVRALLADGMLDEAKGRVKLTDAGKAELERLLAEEQAATDQRRLSGLYEEFTSVNAELKQIITDWQLVDGEQPNDHSDPTYDGKVVASLLGLHERFTSLLDRIVAVAPRLSPYPGRFAAAAERVRDGDHSWVAGPLKDSYHTLWFELHEELIGLAGLSREAEAAAGRAE